MTDDLAKVRARRKQRRESGPAVEFGPSGNAAIDRVMLRVDAAAERHNPAAYYDGKTPTPERITIALDHAGLYGPEVDEALGGEEPMVDEWEEGKRVPDFAQVQALAEMTGFPVKFFYLEAPPPLKGFICGEDGCKPLGGGDDDEDCCPRCGRPN